MKTLTRTGTLLSVLILFSLLFVSQNAFSQGCTSPQEISGVQIWKDSVLKISWATGAENATHSYIQIYDNPEMTVLVTAFLQVHSQGILALDTLETCREYYFRIRNYNSTSGGCFQSGSWTGVTPPYCDGVVGHIFYDRNENCVRDTTEIGKTIQGRVMIQPGNIVVNTDKGGFWHIDSLAAGSYTAEIYVADWMRASCSSTVNFEVLHPDSLTLVEDVGFISDLQCAAPTISVSLPIIRRCFNRTVYVSACNDFFAGDTLREAYSMIELDTLIRVDSATVSYTALGDGLYRFDHGDLAPDECVDYKIFVQISCESVLGQTLCVEGNLYPQTTCYLDTIPADDPVGVSPCTEPWDKSSLKVDGQCVGDSVQFTITNTGDPVGGDMVCYAPVRLFKDGVYVALDSIRLTGGETVNFTYLATGQTMRLEADQHPLHPGNSHPNATIELCGDTLNWTSGLVTVLPFNDQDPATDIYCGEVTGSYDPNDKRGFPTGLGENHILRPNVPLEYMIRFQNTGTDTAFTVVIVDTLDEDLDIFSVQSGVSSHPYQFRMHGPRILEWTFNDILLPDSTTNEPGSHGFVTFKVNQNKDLPDGTLIENTAGIYFDFNDAIITNTATHLIERFQGEIELGLQEEIKGPGYKIFPNPVKNLLQISTEESVEYELISISGKRICSGKVTKQAQIDMSQQMAGVYVLRLKGTKGAFAYKILKR
ncbi:MAG: T9SS type A sorting domain-containing protein [Bacteroidetes bacterium]|nr:MAG: T9SS type A sorting domain-containing protein [Bacteroidota bacterium]